MRRVLRDVRDKMAQHKRSWRDVSFAEMAGSDGTALVMISQEGVYRRETPGQRTILCLVVLRRAGGIGVAVDLDPGVLDAYLNG